MTPLRRGTIVYKMTGSGNDFVLADGRTEPVACWTAEAITEVCSRQLGLGADGFAVIEPGSGPGAVRFHFFNNDGVRAAMCGNASLCATRLAAWLELGPAEGLLLETDAGTYRARCVPGTAERSEITLTDTSRVSAPELPTVAGESLIRMTTVGVPHLVVVVDDLPHLDVRSRGRELRRHAAVGPAGANVNFLAKDGHSWAMRTYERGVEDETLACGTGAVAAAAVLATHGSAKLPWTVQTRSGCELTIAGELGNGGLREPRLTGEGRLVYRAVLGS